MNTLGTVWIAYTYACLLVLLLPLMWFYDDKSKRKDCDVNGELDHTPNSILNDSREYSANCPLLIED